MSDTDRTHRIDRREAEQFLAGHLDSMPGQGGANRAYNTRTRTARSSSHPPCRSLRRRTDHHAPCPSTRAGSRPDYALMSFRLLFVNLARLLP